MQCVFFDTFETVVKEGIGFVERVEPGVEPGVGLVESGVKPGVELGVGLVKSGVKAVKTGDVLVENLEDGAKCVSGVLILVVDRS